MKYFSILLILISSYFLSACNTPTDNGNDASTDTQPVKVAKLTPADGASDQSITTLISITAEQSISNAQIDQISMSLSTQNIPINGMLSLLNGAVVFIPDQPLEYETQYLVTFSITDSSIEASSWTFNTSKDPNPFTVSIETNNEGVVAIDTGITLNFSQPLDSSSISENSLLVKDGSGNLLPFYVLYLIDKQTISLEFYSTLEYDHEYLIEFLQPWQSSEGKSLTTGNTLNFSTQIDNTPPALTHSSPSHGQLDLNNKVNIDLTFSEELLPSSINTSVFTISSITDDLPISFDILNTPPGSNLIRLVPTTALPYNSDILVAVEPGLEDLNGNTLSMSSSITFSTGNDYEKPVIISVTPADTQTEVSVDDSIHIQFSEPLDESSLDTSKIYLYAQLNNYQSKSIKFTTNITGDTLTLTPTEPMSFNTGYELNLQVAVVKDINGNDYWDYEYWSFNTEDYGNKLSMPGAVHAYELDEVSNLLYVLDKINKQISVIDLNNNTVVSTNDLLFVPSRLCIDNASNRLYISNINTSFISEHNLTTLVKLADIPWPAADWGAEDAHFHIQCTATDLYLSTAEWSPQLWKINRSYPYTQTKLDAIASVGDFYQSSNGDIFSWFQYGWSAGSANSKVYRFRENGTGDFALIDESTKSYPNHNRDPIDSPIFIDENLNRVINKRYIFNSLNLEQVIYDFGEDVVFYAADLSRNLLATRDSIYNTETYSLIRNLPIIDSDHLLFDTQGDLFLIKNDQTSMYILPESEI